MSKNENNEGTVSDRISCLPDSLLFHILSFLPTNTCVATLPLVSSRWVHLWEHLQTFHFSNDTDDIKLFKKFAFFVDAVLAIRRSRDIRKFHLDCCLINMLAFHSVNVWLRAAMGPCLEELNVELPGINETNNVVLGPTLFSSCTNLVSLSLGGEFDLKVQHPSAVIHFPSLKNLYLDICSVDSIDALLTGCPILQTLDIINAPDSLSRFRVPPSLNRLKYNDYDSSITTYIEIKDAPHLRYLSITTKGTFDTTVGNLQNVVEAYIDVYFQNESESVNPLLKVLRALSGTKHLSLSSKTTKPLLCAPILDFPEFCNLLHLNITLSYFDSNLLTNVLEKCHVLQYLIINSKKEALPRPASESQSTRIPNFFLYHLTFIHIKGYRGYEDELAFTKYILCNSLALETMIIIAHSSLNVNEKLSILKRLSNIPRASCVCQLDFDRVISP